MELTRTDGVDRRHASVAAELERRDGVAVARARAATSAAISSVVGLPFVISIIECSQGHVAVFTVWRR